MSQPPTVIVNNIQRNNGCLGGCGTAFGVLLVIGLAVEYWYIALAVAVVGVALGFIVHRQRALTVDERMPPWRPGAVSPSAATLGRACAACGATDGVGAFCATCGTATGRTCSGCGETGLLSPFCPACGAATHAPIRPD